jgi:hypothetical protein
MTLGILADIHEDAPKPSLAQELFWFFEHY